MSDSEDAIRRLRHDLRGALGAIQMNLETLEALEEDRSADGERRKAALHRASEAVAEAVRLTDRIEDPASAQG